MYKKGGDFRCGFKSQCKWGAARETEPTDKHIHHKRGTKKGKNQNQNDVGFSVFHILHSLTSGSTQNSTLD